MVFSSPWAPLDIPKCNILSWLFPHGSTPSDKAIWIDAADSSHSLSPAQALSWIKRFAVGLDQLGIREGEAVLVFTPNQIFVPLVYLASAGSKRCFTGINPSFTTDEASFQMKASGAALVLVHAALVDTGVAAAKKANIPLDRLYLFSEKGTPTTKGLQNWQTILATEEESESWRWDSLQGEIATQTTAVINFSSGTTGLPKGVCISHYNLVSNTAQAIFNNTKYIGVEKVQAQRWLAFLPLYHAFSQLFTINFACKLNIPVYVMSKFVFEDYLRYIQQFKITALQAVPPVVVMMAKRKETDRYDLSSLEHIGCGAAPLSGDIQNGVMKRWGMVVTQGWGMSETTCAGLMLPGMTKDLTGSVGYLLPNTEARLFDENDREITRDGVPGELWMRGPQIMQRYFNNDEATRNSFSGAWFKTGDVAVTKDGRWWIVDRKKELIKLNGLQIAPAELEAVLLDHTDVADAAVVGVTVHGEELPRAYIVLRDGCPKSSSTAEGIRAFVDSKVAKHKRITGGIQFIDEVPKLASGKIVRKVLKQWAQRDAKTVEARIKARF